MKEQKVFVVIPALNASRTLPEVVKGLSRSLPAASIIVVNDGSSDETSNILSQIGVDFVEHDRNRGKGAALKSGINRALEKNSELIFTIDADGQHNPEECKSFLKKMRVEGLDLVVGSRMSNLSRMPMHRVISNKVTSILVSMRINQRISDSQSGFRLYRARVLRKLNLKTNNFQMETEALIKAGLLGYSIGHVGIETLYHRKPVSYIQFIDILRFLQIYIESFFWTKRRLNGNRIS